MHRFLFEVDDKQSEWNARRVSSAWALVVWRLADAYQAIFTYILKYRNCLLTATAQMVWRTYERNISTRHRYNLSFRQILSL